MFQQTNLMQYRYKNLVNAEKESPSFLFCISPENRKRAHALCNRNDLLAYFQEDATPLEEVIKDVDANGKYEIVVFDSDAMSFRDILTHLTSAGEKGHTWILGLYSAKRDVLITPGFVYE
jgi:hypothetical protein